MAGSFIISWFTFTTRWIEKVPFLKPQVVNFALPAYVRTTKQDL
jgi:hypothetical protein